MDKNLFICKKCIEDLRNKTSGTYMQYRGFFSMVEVPQNHICPKCKNVLVETQMLLEDSRILTKIQNDTNFIEAMIDLKEKDPIEYQLKMSQFKTQVQQQENIQKQQSEQSKVHCPYCKSNNVRKISGTERVASVAMMGIFSKKINKSFKCENCGGTF